MAMSTSSVMCRKRACRGPRQRVQAEDALDVAEGRALQRLTADLGGLVQVDDRAGAPGPEGERLAEVVQPGGTFRAGNCRPDLLDALGPMASRRIRLPWLIGPTGSPGAVARAAARYRAMASSKREAGPPARACPPEGREILIWGAVDERVHVTLDHPLTVFQEWSQTCVLKS
jgi:hypothetical protein